MLLLSQIVSQLTNLFAFPTMKQLTNPTINKGKRGKMDSRKALMTTWREI
jgi:hypothetical protein